MIGRRAAWSFFTVFATFFAVMFVWPVARVIAGGFYFEGRWTLRFVLGVFRNPVYAEGLRNSLALATATTTLAMFLAIPLAWLGHRYDFTGKSLLSGLILAPMILPPFVGAMGFQQIFGQYGALNALLRLGPVDWLGRGRFAGVVLLQALSLYPVLYLNIVAALANIDPAMEEAAENLGCPTWKRFFLITLPLALTGIFAGGTIVFIWSFTELGTPLIMNYTRCTAVQVYDALKEIGANPFPYALVFTMLACSVLIYCVMRLLIGRRAFAMQGRASIAYTARRASGWKALAVAFPFIVVLILALAPHMGVVLASFAVPGSWYRGVLPEEFTLRNYTEALGHGMTVSSIRNSLLFSSLAVVLNMVLGVSIAFVVVRSDIRGRSVLDAMAMAPLAVPGMVMAFGYLSVSAFFANMTWVKENAAWQSLLDVRTNPTLFLVVAYAVRRLPYMVRSAVAGLQQTAAAYEESAANLGAPPLTVARRVTLPLIAANLTAGALLVFAFSMLEVSDSLMLAQREDYYPITKTIYELFQLIGVGRHTAAALGAWGMLFLAVTIVGAGLLLGRKLGALFRI